MKFLKYAIYIAFNFIRLSFKSILHLGRIKFKVIQIISPRASIEIEGNTSGVILNNLVSIRAGTTLRASGGVILIGNNVFINKNCIVVSKDKIEIGEGTTIGPNVMIYDHDHAFGRSRRVSKEPYKKAPVKVGKNVWIGAGAIILKGTSIGDNSIIGAGTILSGEIPSNTLVVQERKIKYTKIE